MGRLLVRLAATALGLLALAGCSSPCQDLADRVCNCQPAGALRDSCKSSAKNQIGSANPTSGDESYCADKLKTCPDPESTPTECQVLLTEAGKEACGLAFPAADGGVPDAGTQ